MSCKSKKKILSYNRMYFHKFHLLSIPPKICKIKTSALSQQKGITSKGKNPKLSVFYYNIQLHMLRTIAYHPN